MINIGIKAVPVQLLTGKYEIPVCSKAVWEKLAGDNYKEACGMLIDLKSNYWLDDTEQVLFVEAYKKQIKKIREKLGLTVPYYPVEDSKDTVKYDRYTVSDKLVADYANMDIYKINDISILDYWCLERDAFIFQLSQTEKGREYLNNAYRITCTEADENIKL